MGLPKMKQDKWDDTCYMLILSEPINHFLSGDCRSETGEEKDVLLHII